MRMNEDINAIYSQQNIILVNQTLKKYYMQLVLQLEERENVKTLDE